MGLHDTLSEFELTSPFLDIQYNNIPVWQAIAIGFVWILSWVGIGTGLIWLYAVWFAAQVGFQTALLVGIALIIFSVGTE